MTLLFYYRRFIQIVKCCMYFGEKHGEGGEGGGGENNMVTLLTSESSMQSPPSNTTKVANLGTRISQYALDICKSKGIRVEPVVDFYKRYAKIILLFYYTVGCS